MDEDQAYRDDVAGMSATFVSIQSVEHIGSGVIRLEFTDDTGRPMLLDMSELEAPLLARSLYDELEGNDVG